MAKYWYNFHMYSAKPINITAEKVDTLLLVYVNSNVFVTGSPFSSKSGSGQWFGCQLCFLQTPPFLPPISTSLQLCCLAHTKSRMLKLTQEKISNYFTILSRSLNDNLNFSISYSIQTIYICHMYTET